MPPARPACSVSDEAIVQYLDELGRGNVTRDDMRAMLNRMQRAAGVSRSTMSLMRCARKCWPTTISPAIVSLSKPSRREQRWKDWLRVNDRVVVEAAAIPVESFVVDVPEPTEAGADRVLRRVQEPRAAAR